MADKGNDISVKLLAGQQKLERDVAGLKTDVSGLKTDVADLKEGQQRLETGFSGLKEGQNRVEKFLLNLENIIVPKINAMYENNISNSQQIKKTEEAEIKNAKKIENHELRIVRLEQSKQ